MINVIVRILSLHLYCETHIGSAPARIWQSHYFPHAARMDVMFSVRCQRRGTLIHAIQADTMYVGLGPGILSQHESESGYAPARSSLLG